MVKLQVLRIIIHLLVDELRKVVTMEDPQHSFVFKASSSASERRGIRRRGVPEKTAEVVSSGTGKAEHLKKITESKQQRNNKDNTLPSKKGVQDTNGVVKIKEKPQENSNTALNSPLALIPISQILRGIPQSPHFLQLRKYSELTQQKLVAAWVQTFEETVDQIQGLNTKDFWARACKLWKTMEDLQGVGYNVIPIRRRLMEMTEVMIELKQSKLEIVTLKSKAENHRMEKSRLKNEILSLQVMVEWEEVNMVLVSNEADEMEKELPKYDDLLAKLAIKPLGVST